MENCSLVGLWHKTKLNFSQPKALKLNLSLLNLQGIQNLEKSLFTLPRTSTNSLVKVLNLDLNFAWTLKKFWPNFFSDQKFFWTTILLDKIYFVNQNFFCEQKFFWDNLFSEYFFSDQIFISDQIFFWTNNFFWTKKSSFIPKNFQTSFYYNQIFFGSNIFFGKILFLDQTFFLAKLFFGAEIFLG